MKVDDIGQHHLSTNIMKWEIETSPHYCMLLFFLFSHFSIFHLSYSIFARKTTTKTTTTKCVYIVNVNATTNIDKDVNLERRERERELMRSNSERDRSTNSHPRELSASNSGREFNNDHHRSGGNGNVATNVGGSGDASLAKYSCRGEVNKT
jgi:hypothetical protein